jgi:regulator of sigma E protease
MLSSILLFILALSVLIVVHEAGHYLCARWMGVHVEVFSLGYGKRLFGKKIAGTDFRVSIFPLGGYAKMYGDITEEVAAEMVRSPGRKRKGKKDIESADKDVFHLDSPELKKSVEPKEYIPPEKSFFNKKRWQKAIILFGGSVFNIILAVIFIWIANIAGREVPVYKSYPPVLGGVIDSSPAAAAGLKTGDRILSINGQKMPDWDHVEVYVMMSPKDKLSIVLDRAGSEMPFSVQPIPVGPHKIGYIGVLNNSPLHISEVLKSSVAEKVGLQVGDIIKTINGKKILYWVDGVRLISESPGKMLMLEIERDKKMITVEAAPEVIKDKKTGEVTGQLGFRPGSPMKIVKMDALDGLWESINENVRFTGLFFVSLGKLIRGKLSFSSMSGPLEIGRISIEVAQQGALPLIYLMGFIALNLGLFNLLPIPMFDGGAILILILEGLRRKDFKMVTKERILQIGFFFIIALVIIVFYFDIMKAFVK